MDTSLEGVAVSRVGPRLKLSPRYLWVGLLVFVLGWLTFVPVMRLIAGSFTASEQPGVFTLANYVRVFSDPLTYELFANSLIFALGSCALSLVLGTTLAWIIERTDTPFRRFFYTVTLVPIIVPGIVMTIAWLFLLSPRIGWINSIIKNVFGIQQPLFDVYSMAGMIWVEGLGTSPLVFLLMSAAMKSMDPSLEESASVSGASTMRTLRRVTLPLMLPTMLSVMLIVFIRVLEAFEVPAVIGLPGRTYVLTSRIYLALAKSPQDYGMAGALASVFLVLSVAGILLYQRVTRRADRYATVSGKAYRPRTIPLGRWKYAALAFLVIYILLIIVMPLAILLWMSFLPFFAAPSPQQISRFTLDNYQRMLTFPNVLAATRNSLILAVSAAVLSTLLAAIVAWISLRSRIWGRQVLDILAFLPVAVPGIVMGAALVAMYASFPIPIYQTIWVLMVAYVTRFFPYGMRAASGSLLQLRKELEEAGEVSGADWLTRFRLIVLPLLRPGLLAGATYILIVSIRELSSSALLTGPNSPVLAVLILEFQEAGNYTAVAALSILMVLAMAILVAIIQKVVGRVGIQAR